MCGYTTRSKYYAQDFVVFWFVCYVPRGHLIETGVIRVSSHERHGVWNHWPRLYLFNRLFGLESKEHHKSALLALCEGNPQVTSEFLSQRACDVENISWHHHVVRASEVISWRYSCLETLSTSLALYVGNPPVTSEFPTQRAVIQSLDDVFVVSPIKPLKKQSISRWNETS